MATKDYYNTLGVDKNATKEDIKQAYKRLAKKYHPDINKDSGATEKFKEINEAAAILSDEKKRANYDRFGTSDEAFGPGGFDFRDFSEGFGRDFDADDVFDQFFGGNGFFGGRQRRRGGAERGADLRFEMEITLEDAANGVSKQITIPKLETCKTCKGAGAEDKADIITCKFCGGSGQMTHQQRTPFGVFQTTNTCKGCNGSGRQIKKPCRECDGDGRVDVKKTIDLKIPAGVDTGTRVRVEGEGEAGVKGGPTGDLYIIIHLKPHKIFERDGNNIYVEIPISFTQAVLGDEIDVPTIDGEATLKIPSGTQSETTFRLKGRGIPHLRGGGAGDEMIKVKVEVPTRISSRQRELLEEFKTLSDNPQKGFFDKIKRMF